MKKKLLSVILAVVMLVGLVSTVAFADDVDAAADVECVNLYQPSCQPISTPICQPICKPVFKPFVCLDCCEVTAPDLVYTGLEQYPDISVINGEKVFDPSEYSVWYDPNEGHIDVGAYVFKLMGKYPCSGSLYGCGKYSYNIVARDINDENISKSIESPFYYAGKEITPIPELVNGWTGASLVEGVDFVIAGYENNVEVGTAYCIIKGIGNYCGECKLAFEIIPNEYKITKGDGQTITKKEGTDVTAEFETNGNVYFGDNIKIDGVLIEYKKDFTVSGDEEHTEIVLLADFVKTLKDGKHTIEVIYHDGSCSGTFNVTHVAKAPKTADGSNLVLWIAIVTAALAAAGFAASRRRRCE